ncbi:MAG TPA: FecR domain-containing protein [Albitalea sp.]|uniref:FecR domain-containing protein n=1 Tax=Piscinibacter sp. TaxID=1903157 RepID=UPI002ED36CCC
MRGLILAATIAASCSVAAAEVPSTLTILEGEALIVRGSGRVHAAEGVRLSPGDIVETGASTFAQVELSDQSVVQFGPSTRVMINGSTAKSKPERWLYLMEGWMKMSGAKRDAASGPPFDLRAPLFEIPANPGVVVLRATPGELNLFVERGDARLAERHPGAQPTMVSLRAGDYYRRKAPARGSVNPGPMQAFLGDMPRFFRDSLPLRIDRYRDHPVQPKEAPDFAYADVEAWLKAEPSVRRPLMQRWRGKAREQAFRTALIANLSAHPEWDPILFPEKYKPKEPPAPPRGTVAVTRPAPAASTASP